MVFLSTLSHHEVYTSEEIDNILEELEREIASATSNDEAGIPTNSVDGC